MTNPTLERAARAVAICRGWDEAYADEYDAERYHRENGPCAYVDEARAVLMAVRDDMLDPKSGRVFDRSAASSLSAILAEGE